MTRAAIYCRISDDRAGGGLGVARQEVDCRVVGERRGWEIATVLVDNDISAYSGKRRPAYAELCDAIKAGTVDAVIAWHPDRLHRSPRELEDFIDLLEATGCQVATVTAGDLDLSTPSGRMTARIVGAVARGESEHKSARIRRQKAQAVELGLPNGGGRSFGYDTDGRTVIEHEADAIRQAAAAILAGASTRAVTQQWNEQGILTPRGNGWAPQVVRSLLLRPRIAGLREHHGEIVGTADWAPVVSEADWYALHRLLTSRPGVSHPRKWAWASVLMCGKCGAPLRTAKVNGKRGWSCKKLTTPTACGGLSVAAGPLEAYLTERLFAHNPMPAVSKLRGKAVAAGQNAPADVDALNDRLAALEDARFIEGTLSEAGYLRARTELLKRRDAALAEQATSVIVDLGERNWREWWDDGATLDQQRRMIEQAFDHITVNPAPHRGARFTSDRVELWRNTITGPVRWPD